MGLADRDYMRRRWEKRAELERRSERNRPLWIALAVVAAVALAIWLNSH